MAVLINSPRQTFAICSIQSGLQEVGLYDGKFDGLFGEESYKGFETLIGEKVERTNAWGAKDIIFNLQRAMVKQGLDTKGLDGIWGNASANSFQKALEDYRRRNKINKYWFAWTGNKNVPQTGVVKIKQWLAKHGKPETHVSYLLSCINFETAGTFKPGITNNVSNAVGLIQFMPEKLKEWGVSEEHMASLSFDSQLDYVFRYFEEYNYINKCKYVEDYYLSIFYPAYVGKNPDTVLAKKGSITYQQNSGAFDKLNKGYYTANDVAMPVVKRYWLGMRIKNRAIEPQLD